MSIGRRAFFPSAVLTSVLAGTMIVFGTAAWAADESETTDVKQFEANWESLETHEVPQWFEDAKLGIFIHWGIYSVPAWATPSGSFADGMAPEDWLKNNAYAEWYLNTMKIDGSPTMKHHAETYGADFDYYDFIPEFNKGIRQWKPAEWAKLFSDIGARYVVLTTKHHDGFTLWPSTVENPNLPEGKRHATRDLVGELTTAVRAQGLTMGLYYSGGLDWSFWKKPIAKPEDWRESIKGTYTPEYVAYADAHWRELIDRYRPTILWNDIAYPKQSEITTIVADYYNRFSDGLINNRFSAPHSDFVTPEYTQLEEISEKKWETCRGLGHSFGYNQLEGPETVIPSDELIRLFIDVVSKNGNLLLNVGPKSDGTIPEIQVDRLRALGAWLDMNGEAIFGTRPWERAEGKTTGGIEVRFTRKGEVLYAILMDTPKEKEITLESLDVPRRAEVRLLGSPEVLKAKKRRGGLKVTLPDTLPGSVAHVLVIEP